MILIDRPAEILDKVLVQGKREEAEKLLKQYLDARYEEGYRNATYQYAYTDESGECVVGDPPAKLSEVLDIIAQYPRPILHPGQIRCGWCARLIRDTSDKNVYWNTHKDWWYHVECPQTCGRCGEVVNPGSDDIYGCGTRGLCSAIRYDKEGKPVAAEGINEPLWYHKVCPTRKPIRKCETGGHLIYHGTCACDEPKKCDRCGYCLECNQHVLFDKDSRIGKSFRAVSGILKNALLSEE